MKRIIKDYQTVTPEQLQLIAEAYPDGIDSDLLISFTNAKGEYVKALEVRTDDTIYLFKISAGMIAKIDDYTDDDFDMGDFASDDGDSFPAVEKGEDDEEEKPRRGRPKKAAKPKDDDDDDDFGDDGDDDDDDDYDDDGGDDDDDDDDY